MSNDAPGSIPMIVAPGAAPVVLPEAPGLATRTARGFSWVLLQTMFGKVASVVTQVVLGRLLFKDDFALVGLAYVVTAFAAIVSDAGFSQILIHRQRRFRLWSTPVAWMSLASGVLAAALIALAAPVAARVYAAPQLLPVLLVLALGTPLSTIAVVPTAFLQARMQFRLLASIQTALTIATTALTILLAWRGWGAYSIVLPPIAATIIRTPLMWWLARTPIRLSPQFRRWRFLLSDSSVIIGASFCITVTMQADNLLLGLVASKETLATYYFGFGLAYQVTLLLTGSLASVLFPALSSLRGDPVGQRHAFMQASRILAFIGVPLCIVQAAGAAPALQMMFGAKWLGAIPIVQILSVANALQLLNGPSVSLLQSQGRFRTIFHLTMTFAAIFVSLVLTGALLGGAVGVAWAAGISAVIGGVVMPTAAVRSGGGTLSEILMLYLPPVTIAGVSACIALLVAYAIPFTQVIWWVHGIRLAIIGTVLPTLYLCGMYWFQPATVSLTNKHLERLRKRILHRTEK